MATITVNDQSLLKDLVHSHEPVNVLDEQGMLLGFFTPVRIKKTPDHVLRQIDMKEIDRRRKLPSDRDVPNSQVLEWLKLMQAEEDRRATVGDPAFSTEEGLAFFQSLRETYFQRDGTTKP